MAVWTNRIPTTEAYLTGLTTWRMFFTRCSVLQVGWANTSGTYGLVTLSLGLSLLGYPGLDDLDPVYCMPKSVVEKMGLKKGWVSLERRKVL